MSAPGFKSYHPRRCDRCWYYDEDGRCHGLEPVYVDTEVEGEIETYIEWPHTDEDGFCRHFLPREHGELNAPGTPVEFEEDEDQDG